MPCASKTLSSAAAWSSQPSSYDMPEQPPPTTRIRRPHSGLPSSRRSSETFFAAVSVIVTIRSSRSGERFRNRLTSCSSYHRIPPAKGVTAVSEDATRWQQGELLEGGARRQRGHQHRGPRHVLGTEHPATVRWIADRIPEGRVDGAGHEHPDADAIGPQLLGEDSTEAHHARLRGGVDGRPRKGPLRG